MVKRFDRAGFGRAVKLDNGFLKAPARLTRVGVFEYRRADGSVSREYRPAEEVFHPDSLASFALAPLTDDHPAKPVDAENATSVAVGSVGNPRQDGRFVAAELVVMDSKIVKKVLAGKTELSCGYTCRHEPAPAGATFDGIPYDVIQRDIRGNHVAVVDRGRAGPEVRIQLDSEDAIAVDTAESFETEISDMEKLTLDAVEFEVPAAAKIAIEKALEAARGEVDKLAARADAADVQVKALEAELAKANDPARISAEVKARVALETEARKFVGDADLDGLDAMGVKKAVVAKLSPELTLDGKSADYVSALFDVLTVSARKVNKVTEAVAAAVQSTKADLAAVKTQTEEAAFNARFFKK